MNLFSLVGFIISIILTYIVTNVFLKKKYILTVILLTIIILIMDMSIDVLF